MVDDIIVWWVEQDCFDVMPNASNTARVRQAVGGRDQTPDRAVMALQGPKARQRVERGCPVASRVPRFHVTEFDWNGSICLAAGTGYTGEDGIECVVPAGAAPSFWSAMLECGLAPAGLGARDTLRLEAGFPLHGHELGPGITPLQARLGWVVGWSKPTFRGKQALEREREAGPRRLLAGLVADGRQPPRQTNPVNMGGRRIGEVSSGNFSPTLQRGIAMAFLEPDVSVGDQVEVEGRRQSIGCTVAPTPFVPGGRKSDG